MLLILRDRQLSGSDAVLDTLKERGRRSRCHIQRLGIQLVNRRDMAFFAVGGRSDFEVSEAAFRALLIARLQCRLSSRNWFPDARHYSEKFWPASERNCFRHPRCRMKTSGISSGSSIGFSRQEMNRISSAYRHFAYRLRSCRVRQADALHVAVGEVGCAEEFIFISEVWPSCSKVIEVFFAP